MDKRKLIKKLKEFVFSVNRNYKIKKIYLFGSQATGKAKKDSDIDLIIVSDDFNNMNFFERGTAMYNYWDLDMPVDFICYTTKEFNKLKNQISIVREAIKEGVEI